jgi:hypothetical protein
MVPKNNRTADCYERELQQLRARLAAAEGALREVIADRAGTNAKAVRIGVWFDDDINSRQPARVITTLGVAHLRKALAGREGGA